MEDIAYVIPALVVCGALLAAIIGGLIGGAVVIISRQVAVAIRRRERRRLGGYSHSAPLKIQPQAFRSSRSALSG